MAFVGMAWLTVDVSNADPAQWTYTQTSVSHTSGASILRHLGSGVCHVSLASVHAIDFSHSGTERDGFYFMTGSIAGADQILARIRHDLVDIRGPH